MDGFPLRLFSQYEKESISFLKGCDYLTLRAVYVLRLENGNSCNTTFFLVELHVVSLRVGALCRISSKIISYNCEICLTISKRNYVFRYIVLFWNKGHFLEISMNSTLIWYYLEIYDLSPWPSFWSFHKKGYKTFYTLEKTPFTLSKVGCSHRSSSIFIGKSNLFPLECTT